MIVTLTPNPSLDRSISVTKLNPGEVHRALDNRVDPGGKGVNVSRALAANGHATVAVLPAAGADATLFASLLDEAGVAYDFLPLAGAVRTNITLVETGGSTTKLNELGRPARTGDAASLLEIVDNHSGGADWVVGCGSLPPGMGGRLYADLIERAHARGVKVAIDTSGDALSAAIAAQPDLIKPNREELEEFVGSPLATLGDVLDAARAVVSQGIGTVVVSLGADGALAVDSTTAVHAWARAENPSSTVGAGDCLLAGFLSAVTAGASIVDAIGTGVRWGTAAIMLPGSKVPAPADLAMVAVTVSENPQLSSPLSESSLVSASTTRKGSS
ncbi:MAG: 1-phosphofructokinase [Actinobacteria bacterium HGW-Actinobacteria-4]|nr:MAG: 1-phosphofructokinase [Actinobacteria bacterium HGW-Actinobacteria-4]